MLERHIKSLVKMQEHRDKVQSALSGLTDAEALSVLTMVMAESMISASESLEQYDRFINKAASFLRDMPRILEAIGDDFAGPDSVKH